MIARARFFGFLVILTGLHILSAPVRGNDLLPQKSLVAIANANVPASIELGLYYLEKRGFSESNLCILDLPEGEEISRADYDAKLLQPLLQFLRQGEFISQRERKASPSLLLKAKNKWASVRGKPSAPPPTAGWQTVNSSVHFLVPMYGVPLRISDLVSKIDSRISTNAENLQEKEISAVDSELAAALYPPYSLKGTLRNPVYNSVTMADGGALGLMTLIVSRLDAPNPAIVRRMIDDALDAEKYGLHGRAFFDARGLRSGGYLSGDFWIKNAYEKVNAFGYESVLDANPEVFSDAYPMDDAAYYLGWYEEHVTPTFKQKEFQFKSGAIAYHLHSGAGATVKSEDKHWVGPLLAAGATATMGAVHEPYLKLTVDLDIFTDRLFSGYSFGESAYMAIPVLSWQMAVIGDPLYRPFRNSLDQQIQAMEADKHPDLEWGYARKARQLYRDGFFLISLNYIKEKIKQTDSLVLREMLGDLYLKNNMAADAGAQYETILEQTDDAATAIRIGARWTDVLDQTGQETLAEQYRLALRQAWAGSGLLDYLDP